MLGRQRLGGSGNQVDVSEHGNSLLHTVGYILRPKSHMYAANEDKTFGTTTRAVPRAIPDAMGYSALVVRV